MLLVCDENQRIVAQFRAKPGLAFARTLVTTATEMREIFRCLKIIPENLIHVEVNYPSINSSFHQLNKGNTMDLESIVESYDKRQTTNAKEVASKTLFVAPITAEMPNDGVLNYLTIETIFDIKDAPDRSVIMVREDQLDIIKCISDNPNLFDVKVATLTGLPTANYSVHFDEATWAFDKVAYAPFISELRIAGELEQQLAAQNKTVHDIERDKYTRKTGDVKAHTDFTVVNTNEPASEADVADDEEFRL